jgi:hypothetical protein
VFKDVDLRDIGSWLILEVSQFLGKVFLLLSPVLALADRMCDGDCLVLLFGRIPPFVNVGEVLSFRGPKGVEGSDGPLEPSVFK